MTQAERATSRATHATLLALVMVSHRNQYLQVKLQAPCKSFQAENAQKKGATWFAMPRPGYEAFRFRR
ncbi:hypothetical protein SBA5_450056 [Candidatus Sulfotelmatomonas gaucii]|uniref:Uncharacterized protein n=1 Tax=Candidatus Sulfuritelmatomonas gaucii TaxID=2043161 RepID=A0A2N9LMC1_9BACT|nr:hypothetical protein SBA5_450056 [Candidatus Sulfotelmatomonas gaucii]